MVVDIIDKTIINFVDVGIGSCAICKQNNRPFMKICGDSKCDAVWLDTGELTLLYDYDPCFRVTAEVKIVRK